MPATPTRVTKAKDITPDPTVPTWSPPETQEAQEAQWETPGPKSTAKPRNIASRHTPTPCKSTNPYAVLADGSPKSRTGTNNSAPVKEASKTRGRRRRRGRGGKKAPAGRGGHQQNQQQWRQTAGIDEQQNAAQNNHPRGDTPNQPGRGRGRGGGQWRGGGNGRDRAGAARSRLNARAKTFVPSSRNHPETSSAHNQVGTSERNIHQARGGGGRNRGGQGNDRGRSDHQRNKSSGNNNGLAGRNDRGVHTTTTQPTTILQRDKPKPAPILLHPTEKPSALSIRTKTWRRPIQRQRQGAISGGLLPGDDWPTLTESVSAAKGEPVLKFKSVEWGTGKGESSGEEGREEKDREDDDVSPRKVSGKEKGEGGGGAELEERFEGLAIGLEDEELEKKAGSGAEVTRHLPNLQTNNLDGAAEQ